jgi:hypothetical protein
MERENEVQLTAVNREKSGTSPSFSSLKQVAAGVPWLGDAGYRVEADGY